MGLGAMTAAEQSCQESRLKCESRGDQGHLEDVSRDGHLCLETSKCHHE